MLPAEHLAGTLTRPPGVAHDSVLWACTCAPCWVAGVSDVFDSLEIWHHWMFTMSLFPMAVGHFGDRIEI